MKPEQALDAVADKVLTYRPKPKSKPAKKRSRVRKRLIANTPPKLRRRLIHND